MKVKEPVGLGGRLPVNVNGGRDPVGLGGKLPVKEGNPDGKPDGIPDGTWATGAAEAVNAKMAAARTAVIRTILKCC